MGQNEVRLAWGFEQFTAIALASESNRNFIVSHMVIVCCVIVITLLIGINSFRENSPDRQQQMAENDSGEAGKGGYSAWIFSGVC